MDTSKIKVLVDIDFSALEQRMLAHLMNEGSTEERVYLKGCAAFVPFRYPEERCPFSTSWYISTWTKGWDDVKKIYLKNRR